MSADGAPRDSGDSTEEAVLLHRYPYQGSEAAALRDGHGPYVHGAAEAEQEDGHVGGEDQVHASEDTLRTVRESR